MRIYNIVSKYVPHDVVNVLREGNGIFVLSGRKLSDQQTFAYVNQFMEKDNTDRLTKALQESGPAFGIEVGEIREVSRPFTVTEDGEFRHIEQPKLEQRTMGLISPPPEKDE